MKFLTWTLHRPASDVFATYRSLPDTEPWYSPNYVVESETIPNDWDYRKKSFIEMIEKYPNKFHAIGMHEFKVLDTGRIVNSGFSSDTFYVLNDTRDDIAHPVPTSLRYLMHTYPDIKWAIQPTCFGESRVNKLLDNVGGSQDAFIADLYDIIRLYKEKGFPISTAEIDFEKTKTRVGDEAGNNGIPDWEKFADLLVRVKNEICIPLGVELRVNLLSLTNDYTPSYYAWHDYATIASRNVVDEYQIMSYDFSWGGSAPGPSTPIWWLTQILEHVKRVLPEEKVYIGNAGYGRRWPLWNTNYGVTLDYKQLMLVQNGAYVHNAGATNPDGNFYFNDQDFAPIAGFNDEASDYQRTYIDVYDRFKLSANGGTESFFIDRSVGKDYVTNYSCFQSPVFTGVEAIATEAVQTGITQKGTDPYVEERATGLPPATFYPYSVDGSEGSSLSFNIPLSVGGTYRLVALVSFPFFGRDNFIMNINGTDFHLNQARPNWYPYITYPSIHWFDCGNVLLGTSNTISITNTNGAGILGFVVCSTFDPNPSGGYIEFPANLQKLKKRSETKVDGKSLIVDAQFPEVMRICTEILRRPPRPAIIWEDIFSSYNQDDRLDTSMYYQKIDTTDNTGFSQGVWTVVEETEEDYAYAYNDSTSASCQLVLNTTFNSDLMVETEMRLDATCPDSIYGIRLYAQNTGYIEDGYVAELDYRTQTVRLVHENGALQEVLVTVPMSESLKVSLGVRFNVRVYILDGKLSFWVGDRCYIDRFTLPYAKPLGGGFGIYTHLSKLKLYKYNVSSLERFERMERVKVTVDGVDYVYGSVPRSTTAIDEFGYLVYNGYPADLSEAVKDPENPDTGEASGSLNSNTVLDTEDTPEAWSLDYRNLPICDVPSWIGKKTVTLTMLDAGIWLRNLYIGDAEGMSVAYNSDRIGFIKTVNLVTDYGCKGIGMWTLGQEDPTIYSYIPNSR